MINPQKKISLKAAVKSFKQNNNNNSAIPSA